MAKRKKKGSGKRSYKRRKGKKAAKNYKHHIKSAGSTFGCYGKRVRAGKSRKKVQRVFCARIKK